MKKPWWRRLHPGLALYLVMVGVLLLAGLVLSRVLPGRRSTDRFTILQINDVYKVEGIERETIGGLARVRALRTALEQDGRPVLLLHGGDFLYPSVMSKFLDARPMIRCLNLLDGDKEAFDERMVVTFGNHEFDNKSRDVLAQRILESGFRWIGSNVLFRDQVGGPVQPASHFFKNVSDDFVVNLEGIRVGIFSLTIDDTAQPWVEYRYKDRGSRHNLVREALNRLKDQGADVLVALTHQDHKEDKLLAEAFPEIDLIVGGHDHFHIQERVGRTWITKADADARSAVRIDVALLEDGTVFAAPQKIALDSDSPKDPAVNDAAQAARKELEQVYKSSKKHSLDEEVATTENFLEGVETAVRGHETALGNLLADSIREIMSTRVAFLNGGTIRLNDNIPAGGKITREDLEGIFYFDNELVSFVLTPKDLVDILNNSVSQVHLGSGRFLQVSCIRFLYRAGRSSEGPKYTVDSKDVWICPEGKPGAPFSQWDRLDEVAGPITASTVKYLWEKGSKEGYSLFAEAENGKSPQQNQAPKDWRPEFEKKLQNLQGKMVQAKVEGRIQRADG